MDNSTTLITSLRTQARVIGALIVRELLTNYGRRNIGFLWTFIQPASLIMVFVILHATIGRGVNHGISVITVILTGFGCLTLWRNAASQCLNAIKPNISLLNHLPIHLIDILLARILLSITSTTGSLLCLLLLFYTIGWASAPANILLMMQAWLLLSCFGIGLGLVLAVLAYRYELVKTIWSLLSLPLMFLSGAFFMLNWIPAPYREALLWVPMLNGTEMLRQGYYGDMVNTYYSVEYLGGVSLMLILTGLYLLKDLQQRIIP